MAESQQKFTVNIPVELNASERLELAELIIDHVYERTDSGLDVNNKSFTPYAKSYSKSKDFRLAGKSNVVNLQLTGEMMRSLEVINHTSGEITIGYETGTEENDKAAWAAASDNGPSREFLGISDKTLNLLIKSIELNRTDEKEEASKTVAIRILERLGLKDNES